MIARAITLVASARLFMRQCFWDGTERLIEKIGGADVAPLPAVFRALAST